MASSLTGIFKGKTVEFDSVVETKTIHWKQGSVLGIGGDRSQTYKECHYTLDGQILIVFVQSDWELPKPLTMDDKLQVRRALVVLHAVYYPFKKTNDHNLLLQFVSHIPL